MKWIWDYAISLTEKACCDERYRFTIAMWYQAMYQVPRSLLRSIETQQYEIQTSNREVRLYRVARPKVCIMIRIVLRMVAT